MGKKLVRWGEAAALFFGWAFVCVQAISLLKIVFGFGELTEGMLEMWAFLAFRPNFVPDLFVRFFA